MKALLEVNTVNKVHDTAKSLGQTEVQLSGVTTSQVRALLKKAGKRIGSVHFHKRSNGELRKMSYRLGVTTPTYAEKPKGTGNRSTINQKNKQLTVIDTNKVIRNKSGEIQYSNGKQQRGAWRNVPLENVVRIKVDGVVYNIER